MANHDCTYETTMRKLFTFLVVIVLTSPAWATFTCGTPASINACGTTTACAITVTSTNAGAFEIVGYGAAATSKTITSVTCAPNGCTSGNAFVHCSSCAASIANGASSDLYYTLNSASGNTTITVNHTSSATSATGAFFMECTFTGTSIAVDSGTPNGNTVSNTTNTLRGGVPVTISGTNDVIVQLLAASTSITVSAISPAAYSVLSAITEASGSQAFAAAPNSTTGTTPTWTFSSNAFSAGSALAISETSVSNSAIGGPNQLGGNGLVK